MPEDAKTIYQNLLEDIKDAYLRDDFDAYLAMMGLPHEIKTFEDTHIFETVDDFRRLFEGMRDNLSGHGVTQFLRLCLEANFTSPDEIVGTHETHITRNTAYIQAPYPVMSKLQRRQGSWVVVASQNALDDKNSVGTVLRNAVGHSSPQTQQTTSLKERDDD